MGLELSVEGLNCTRNGRKDAEKADDLPIRVF